MVEETGQAYAYTGDDPVNERDPRGLDGDGFDAAENGGGSIPLGEEQEMEHGGAERDAEQTNEDLNSLTVGRGQSYNTKAEARSARIGEAGASANRFFRDATGKSVDFRIDPTENGYNLKFFSPARNAGWGKSFVQEISPTGDVLREYKDTINPEGKVIERKWLHGG
jgi:hypothetical protein